MSSIQYAYPLILNKVASPHYITPTLRRARLLDWLNKASTCRATVIAADAGYGKTTLLWQWEREVDFPCYWFKLDRNDRDWTLHISYLIEAISCRHEGFGRRAHSMLQQLGGPGSSRPGVAAYLLAEMYERLTEPCTFIIDDWQYVNAVTEVRGLWNQILRDAPPTCRFVFASRTKPRLQFARFMTHGGFALLQTDECRFTEGEIEELFRDIYQDPLDAIELHELERRTEGWAASLQLVEVSLRERPTPSARRDFIRSIVASTDSDLFDFLAEEVLDQQPTETRNFLLATSILQQVTPELAERLAGTHEGNRELVDLEQSGLFTYRLDDNRYRYHNLFREFLERRLVQERSAAEVVGLHIHAASYFETTERWPEAIHHYLRAGLQRQAARLIAKHGEELVEDGRLGLVDEWLRQLPERAISENARLSLLQGEACGFRGDWGLAFAALERARRYFARKGDRRMEALACVKLSSLHHYHGDPRAAAAVADDGLRIVPADSVATRLRLEGNRAVTRGMSEDSYQSVVAACKRIAIEATGAGLDHFAAIALHNIGTIQMFMAQTAEAADNLERASRFWRTLPANPFSDNAELVLVHLLQGQVQKAEALAIASVEQTRTWRRAHAEALIGRAAVHAYRGEHADEIDILQRLNAEGGVLGISNELVGAALVDALFLARRSPEEMQEVLHRTASGPSDPRHHAHIAVAHALVSHRLGCGEQCLRLAENAIALWDARGARFLATRARVKLALLALEHGRPVGIRMARKAIADATSSRLLRYLRWWLRMYVPHVRRLAAQPGGPEMVGRLLESDPDGWRAAAAAIVPDVGPSSRTHFLDMLVKHSNAGTLASLRGVAGEDVAAARRQLTIRAAPRIYVRTLGPLSIHRSGWDGPQVHVEKRRLRLLFGLLCAYSGRSLPRDEVLDLLWPDSDPGAAVNSLNQAVFQARRVLDSNYRDGESPAYVLSTSEGVQFNPNLVRTDLDELRTLGRELDGAAGGSRARVIHRMVDLIRGQFLDDLRYEDWVGRHQQTIHAEIRDLVLPVAEQGGAAVDPTLAVRAAYALVGLDDFDERAHIAIASNLALGGRTKAALKSLASFAERMQRELDVPPSPLIEEAKAALHRQHPERRVLLD